MKKLVFVVQVDIEEEKDFDLREPNVRKYIRDFKEETEALYDTRVKIDEVKL